MAQDHMRQLGDAARRLKHAAPQEWQDFYTAFQLQTHDFTVAVSDALPEHILIAQGRSKAARAFLQTLFECDRVSQPERPLPLAHADGAYHA